MSGRRYAILVGTSEFPDEPKLAALRCPVHDVEGMREVLESPELGAFDEVAVLANRPHNEVNFKINEVLNRAQKSDFVLIYYSGHGKLDRSGRLHLTTSDTRLDVLGATAISWPRVVDYLRDAYTTKVAVLLDCCYGGAAGASFRSTVEDQLQQATQARGTYVMTAATSTELAREQEHDEYGLFTKHVIEGIKTGEADLDSDGHISMDDLYRYVQDRLREDGGQQPTMTGIDVRGELFIAKSRSTKREDRLKKIRKRLYSLAAREYVSDALVASAIEVASLRPTEHTEEQKRLDDLLDRYMAAKISVGELARQWYIGSPIAGPPAEATEESTGPAFEFDLRSQDDAAVDDSPSFDLEPRREEEEPAERAVDPTPEPKPRLIPEPKPQPGPVPVPPPRTQGSKAPAVAIAFIAGLALIAFVVFKLISKPDRTDSAGTTGGGTVQTEGIRDPSATEIAERDSQRLAAEKEGRYEEAARLSAQLALDAPADELKYRIAQFRNLIEFDEVEAASVGNSLLDGLAKDDPLALNTMAWAVVRDRTSAIQSLALTRTATSMAERAAELTSYRDPYKLDTLAFTLYKFGGSVERARSLEYSAIQYAQADSGFPADELAAMRERYSRMGG